MTPTSKSVRRFLPLKSVHYLLLLLLEERPTHGIDLLDRLAEASDGTVRLNAGSLYRTIARLVDDGLIRSAPVEAHPGAGPPRKAYRVTALGRSVLEAEAARQTELLDLASRLNLTRKGS